MRKILLSTCFLVVSYASFSQMLYNMGDSLIATYRATSFQQTNSALNSQSIVFDDVHIPATTVAGYDSIRLTLLKFALLRYANAPATTMNVWITPVVDTATSYTTLIKVPPTHIGSISLPANTGANSALIFSLGDSVNTLASVKVDTGAYYSNYTSFFVGISFADTTGNGWILGGSTGNTTINDNVFWRYRPGATPEVSPLAFAAPTKSRFYLQVFGYPSAPLPVTLIRFAGDRVSNGNLLKWITATESNNYGFEIQKSANGVEFTTIATIISKADNGNSNTELDYSYTDNSPYAGITYYRLKQVDKDGKFAYSSIISIKSENIKQLNITSIYPNPTRNDLKLVMSAASAEKVTVMVIDISGKVHKQLNTDLIQGSNNITINVGSLSTGIYYLKVITSTGETLTSKFVKN